MARTDAGWTQPSGRCEIPSRYRSTSDSPPSFNSTSCTLHARDPRRATIRNQVHLADCLDGLKDLPSNSIPMTLTSPPYDDLKDYGGHDFHGKFGAVAEELFRVTMKGGVVVWVVADKIKHYTESCTSARQKLRFFEVGFNVYHTMVMARTGSKWPARYRYGDSLEYAYVLSKGKPREINLLRDKPNRQAGMRYKTHRRRLAQRERPSSSLNGKPVSMFGVRPPIWTYAAGGRASAAESYVATHPGLMPEMMARDQILSWSRPGDVILDPLCGVATTCKMALMTGRNYIGFEIDPDYHRLAERRMQDSHQEYRRRLDRLLRGA